ncbi:MAG: hypothetical protein IPJ88_02550 [Myxococcales bacterium]|nr:MAG: hypothetical protein IPJ88_02550 [Myxococcales bacterium]
MHLILIIVVFLSGFVSGCGDTVVDPRGGDSGVGSKDSGSSTDLDAGLIIGGGCDGLGERYQACGQFGECVDTSTDNNNCGGCGVVCGAHERCDFAQCECDSLAGFQVCGESCTSINSDSANCGGCGLACNEGENCQQGSCAVVKAGETCETAIPITFTPVPPLNEEIVEFSLDGYGSGSYGCSEDSEVVFKWVNTDENTGNLQHIFSVDEGVAVGVFRFDPDACPGPNLKCEREIVPTEAKLCNLCQDTTYLITVGKRSDSGALPEKLVLKKRTAILLAPGCNGQGECP